ncbi:MAG: hypothetical protein H8K03_14960 [Nitrospira sp.]|jgi:hypothetical protein|nr:hypothetical protein [Nitrospira sp. BO4]
MKPVDTRTETQSDDQCTWIGGEATVGSQAGRHVRRQARHTPSLFGIILGLTFFGGLTLGSSVGLLCRTKGK